MIADLDLSVPRIMGILNVTPDSFSDGGALYKSRRLDLSSALSAAEKMIRDGADIIDVGGESTRPNADPVTVAEELDRVVPVVEALVTELGARVSVDTSTPEVMAQSAAVGAAMLNDVRALQRPGAEAAALATGLPVCLMHMQGQPKTMQIEPVYQDVVAEVMAFLSGRIGSLLSLGFERDKLLVDPGFGFGKTVEHNLLLLQQLPRFEELGCPVLVGISRKSIFQQVLGRAVDQRLAGSLSAALLAVQRGASIMRVHDVAATRDVLLFMSAVEQA
ncbi:MAG: dihydropteroate synthase [Candidatus Pelagadaptatus aseana]|uniref:dihydropteroate synthase n=1 Tax=Candidatus Pelagadaptatus aseana TaxID=3120508 RepID=UPI0039B24696